MPDSTFITVIRIETEFEFRQGQGLQEPTVFAAVFSQLPFIDHLAPEAHFQLQLILYLPHCVFQPIDKIVGVTM